MGNGSRLLIIILLLAAAPLAWAYRPFGVEDAGVAGRGVSQLELSWDYLSWKNGLRENVFLLVPVHGLTDRLELSLEAPFIVHYLPGPVSHYGIGDINLVAKYQIIPEFTIKGAAKTATGDFNAGLGSGDWDWSVIAVSSKTSGDLTIHGQLGYTWVGKAQNPNLRDIALYGVALDRALTPKLNLVFELNGNRHPDSTSPDDPRTALLGLTYKISDKVILDIGGRAGLTQASPEWSVTAGASATL